MKIALFDKNENYVQHFLHTAQTVYKERMEVVSAEDVTEAKELLEKEEPDIVLVDSGFPWISVKNRLKMYLTEEKGTEDINGVPAVHKFQKFGLLLERIESVLSDYKANPQNYPVECKKTQVTAFVSAAGGTGKTTLAIAYARHYAVSGEQVLMLSMENSSSLSMVFSCEGKKTLSEALTDVTEEEYGKKVEQLIQREHKGVYYIEPAKLPLTDNVSTAERLQHLLQAVYEINAFDRIVIELGDAYLAVSESILEKAEEIMLVTEESDVAFYKTAYFISAYVQADTKKAEEWLDKMMLLINKAHMNMPVGNDMKCIKRRYQIGNCGEYRMAKTVELLTSQMQFLESV